MGFGDSVAANCEIMLQDIDKACYSQVFQLFSLIVYKTPTLKGILINNWYPQIGGGYSSEENYTNASLSGSSSLSRINSLVGKKAFYRQDGIATLANNLHYAVNAEYVGWPAPEWSGRVGPYAMVRTAFAEFIGRNP